MNKLEPRIEKAPEWLREAVLTAYTNRVYDMLLVDNVWYIEDEAPEHEYKAVQETSLMRSLYRQCMRSGSLYIDHSNETLLWDIGIVAGMSTPFLMEVEFYVPYEVLVAAEYDLEFRETVIDILLEG